MARLHPLLEPYKPSSSDPYDAVKAAHLLNRATFGGTRDEVVRVMEQGPQRAVEKLLDFPDASADEQSKTDVPDLSSVGEGYPQTFEDRRKLLLGKTQEERMKLNQMLMAQNRQAMSATMQWWLNRMTYGKYPLHEKLTFFWHGHFTTSARDERSAALMWQQNETWRRNAAGNFRTFIKQVSRDPAMLDYLNNQQNRKAKPNENYARELMELFTLGIGHYTENDIKEAARAFTGWGHDGEDYIFRRFDHDYGIKQFFGRSGNFDGDDVIEIILNNPSCAPYVANRLMNFFVMDEPDPAIAKNLGEVLRENNFDLRPVLQTMFTSKLFYSQNVIGGQIKSPVQLVIGTIKALDIDPPNQGQLVTALEQMGQVPFAPPNVKGWPGGRSWINTSTLFVRYNTAVWLAGGGVPVAGGGGRDGVGAIIGARGMAAARRGGGGPRFNPLVAGSSPEAIVDEWVSRLVQRPISPYRRKVLIDSIGNRVESESAVKNMVQLIVSMPEYQLC